MVSTGAALEVAAGFGLAEEAVEAWVPWAQHGEEQIRGKEEGLGMGGTPAWDPILPEGRRSCGI